MRILFILILSGLLFNHQSRPAQNNSHFPALKTGDIILREGKGWISTQLKNCSTREKKYSHAGIIVLVHHKPLVVHAIGTAGRSGLIAEPLEKFIDPNENRGVAIYRYGLTPSQQVSVKSIVDKLRSQNIAFDDHFDMHTNDAMYCTEFIYKVYNQLFPSCNPISVTITAAGEYVAPDDLYLNQYTQMIASINYSS